MRNIRNVHSVSERDGRQGGENPHAGVSRRHNVKCAEKGEILRGLATPFRAAFSTSGAKSIITKSRQHPRASRAVPHPSTGRAFCCLTHEFEWDRVYSAEYGRRRKVLYARHSCPESSLWWTVLASKGAWSHSVDLKIRCRDVCRNLRVCGNQGLEGPSNLAFIVFIWWRRKTPGNGENKLGKLNSSHRGCGARGACPSA